LNPPGRIAPWKTFWEPAIFWQKFPRSFPVIMRNPRFFFSIFNKRWPTQDLVTGLGTVGFAHPAIDGVTERASTKSQRTV
jgi:hypothetical protein